MSRINFLMISVIAAMAVGCGGSASWDSFSPKTTVKSDLAMKTFKFGWLPQGNPVKAGLGTMTLSFGSFGSSDSVPYTLQQDGGGTATGTADFASPNLTFHVAHTSGSILLTDGETIINKVETDVSDGRIRLTNPDTGVNATANPL